MGKNDKNKNFQIFIAAMVIIGGAFIFQDEIRGVISGVPASVIIGQSCATIGEIKQIACTTALGQAGTMTATCDPATRIWVGQCVPSSTQTTMPSTTPTALIVCQEEYASWNVEVGDSLDEEAKPKTLLAETVRIVSSSGQELTKANTSTSGPTEFKVPCKMDMVTFMMTGDDCYTEDKVLVRGQTYEGNSVPTYYYKDGVPVAVNLEAAYVPASKWGNLSATIWNDDRTAGNTGNITVDANGDTGTDIHVKVKENDDDEAARGVIALLEYIPSMVRKIEIEGYTSDLSAQKDQSQIINDYNHYEQAWRLYRNNKPLTLDRDTRTDDPQEAEFVIRLTASSTNPLMNLTVQPIDSDRFLAASGSKIEWAYGGQYRGEDDNLANLGISSGYEHNSTPMLEIN